MGKPKVTMNPQFVNPYCYYTLKWLTWIFSLPSQKWNSGNLQSGSSIYSWVQDTSWSTPRSALILPRSLWHFPCSTCWFKCPRCLLEIWYKHTWEIVEVCNTVNPTFLYFYFLKHTVIFYVSIDLNCSCQIFSNGRKYCWWIPWRTTSSKYSFTQPNLSDVFPLGFCKK